jgi:hypothetical protein
MQEVWLMLFSSYLLIPLFLTDLKLNFLAAMNVHFSILFEFSPLLPTELFLGHLFRLTTGTFTHCFSDLILQTEWTYKLK